MAEFDNLPEEIVLKIFNYVPQSCLQNVITKVCQKWERISRDTALYYNVHFDVKLSLAIAISIIEKYATFINRLVISRRSDTNDILKVVPACVNLKSLIVNSCTGSSSRCGPFSSEVNAELISAILEKNHRLNMLWITHSTIKHGGIRMSGHSLEALIVKNAYYDRSIEERGLLEQENLKILNLQCLVINKSTLYEVISRNQKTLEIVKLDIWEPQLGSNDQVINAISKCSNLKELLIKNLSFYNISDQSMRELSKLKFLKSITFSKLDHVGPSSFISLFKQPHSKNFTKIYLSSCDGVDNTVVKTIAECCPDLIKLTLHQPKPTIDNIITADDIVYLASKCVKLQALDLCYTHSSIGKAMPDIVQFLPDLKNFKYCLNSSLIINSKIVLASTFTWLISHLQNFHVELSLNSHQDNIIYGYRNNLKR